MLSFVKMLIFASLFINQFSFVHGRLSDLCLEKGTASYYGEHFHGKETANGEKFDQMAFTAAHRTLSFGTLVKVTNLANYESVLVRINDRGPFNKHRIIDLSKGAAESIGLIESGVGEVLVECVFEPNSIIEYTNTKIDTL